MKARQRRIVPQTCRFFEPKGVRGHILGNPKAPVSLLEYGDFEFPSCGRNVRENFTGGVRSGVNGTPTFFIEKLRYDGPQDLTSLLAVIEEVAAEKTA
jgi:protein-disulfide isomerase